MTPGKPWRSSAHAIYNGASRPSLAYSKEVFDVSEFHEPLVAEHMLVQFLQCRLTQKVGIALAGLGKFYDLLGDNSVGEIVRKP